MRVEFLYWDDCPSHPRALADLREVLLQSGLDPDGVVVKEISTDEDAASEGFVGSPTIRVNGVDVQPPENEPTGLSCRVYRRRDGRIAPTPDPADLREALRAASESTVAG